MDENQSLYRMNRLMSITDFDAFSAQMNVGSRAEYYTFITAFGEISPDLVRELVAALKARDSGMVQKKVFELQRILLPIGANGLLWDMERIGDLARTRDWKKCAEWVIMLASRIRGLNKKLHDARIGEAASPEADAALSDTAIMDLRREAGLFGRIRAPIEPEQFEKLRPLMKNREQALDLLRDLMAFSYNRDVDSILTSLHESLSNCEQEYAERLFDNLLRSVHAFEGRADGNEKKKILAVDDMACDLHAINALLRDEYVVYGATNYMAALKVLANSGPNLILLDIDMPGMNGFEMMEMIRRIRAYENTPALFLTGSATLENIVNSRKAGVSDIITKPIDPPFLLSKIKRHLK